MMALAGFGVLRQGESGVWRRQRRLRGKIASLQDQRMAAGCILSRAGESKMEIPVKPLFSLLLLSAATVLPVSAGPIAFGTWYEFSFFDAGVPAMGCFPADPDAPECIPSSGTPTVFADAPPWTFVTGADGATLTVTDAFSHGDVFRIFDRGVSI